MKIDEVLGSLIPEGAKCAVVDFPDYSNPGDSAIWLGQKKWLHKNKNEVVYGCDKNTYSPALLAELLGTGIILLQGGGNFGDLWGAHQHLREQVIQDFPHNKIIQLPQTAFFKEDTSLHKAKEIFNAHGSLTILCRDVPSLKLAQREFTARSFLCPDMAFALSPVKRPCLPQTEIVWLSRTDKESSKKATPFDEPGVILTDWLEEPVTAQMERSRKLHKEIKLHKENQHEVAKALLVTYDALAQQRLLRGCEVLSKGKAVITDRLHAHIICLLLNIPHILLDNSYGKIKGFYDAWTRNNELTKWADVPEELGQCVFSDIDFKNLLTACNVTLSSFDNLVKNLTHFTETEAINKKNWIEAVKKAKEELLSIVHEGERLILADEEQLRNDLGLNNIIPFLEKEQQYAGPPPDDETAIKEVERLRQLHVSFIAFAWPAFWWFNYYTSFFKYLRSAFRCILENERLIVFDLKIYNENAVWPVSGKK